MSDTLKQYPLAPKEIKEEIFNKVEAWMNESLTGDTLWDKSRYAAKAAVAEYLANQNGFTVYEDFAIKPSKETFDNE